MTVKHPRARIIRLKRNNHVPKRRHDLRVTPLRIGRADDGAVPRPAVVADGLDEVVVAVQMHRVGALVVVVDDQADGAGGAGVVDVPLRVVGVGVVTEVGEEEDRVVEVDAEGRVVDAEEE